MNLSLQVKYWVADLSVEMYDHSVHDDPVQKSIQLSVSTALYQHCSNYTLKTLKNLPKNKAAYHQFLKVFKIRNRFVVSKVENGQELYVVVSNQGRQYNQKIQLKEGSTIKLSKSTVQIYRIKYNKSRTVQKTKFQQKVFTDKIFTDIQQKNRIGYQYYEDSNSASTIQQAPFCRYCYQKSIGEENLLAILCKCQGSSKYVHEQCLKSWIEMKAKYCQKKPGVYYAQRNGIKCQICKQQFNIEQVLPCFEDKSMKQFLVIQIQTQETGKVFWIFKLSEIEDSTFTVGRKFQSSISIHDLSVSRQHCRFRWDHKNCKLYVEDMDSKFGTLLKKDCIQITRPTYLQVGRVKILVSPITEQRVTQRIKKTFTKLINSLRSSTEPSNDQQTTYI